MGTFRDFLQTLAWIVVCLFLFVRTTSAVYPGCGDEEFQCGTGECIVSENVCNNKVECEDGSDEIDCQRCEEEVLTTGTPKNDPPNAKITSSASTNYEELLNGDILTFESEKDYAYVGVYDKNAPLKFADRNLTEVSFSVGGQTTGIAVYYSVENQRGLITVDEEQVTMPGTMDWLRVTVKLDELSAESLAVKLSKPAGGMASISDMVLKACKKAEPVCQEVTCKSKDRVYTECIIEEANEITSATIIEDYMRRPCYFHDNPPPGGYQRKDPGYFGYKNNILWVDHGCRALFKVCYF